MTVRPAVSVVVVAHDMVRELPRTIESLSSRHQLGIGADEYEIVVVDNGSPDPVTVTDLDPGDVHLRCLRLDEAPASPARAANLGIRSATAPLVGLIVDGARMATPGLVAGARRAARVAAKPVVATAGFHLGPGRHMDADATGYDQDAEDALLAGVDWRQDGYALFAISTFAGSSGRGWFGPFGESSALFLPDEVWDELGGLDEAFTLPGGGLVNHDVYRRACELVDTTLVVLLGEATFHQIHGGAATSRRFTWDEMAADYEQVRGRPHRPPTNPAVYVGTVPDAALDHLAHSVERARSRRRR